MADDADKELKITILTNADTQAVEEYNSELRKLGYGIDDDTEKTVKNAAAAGQSMESRRELRRAFEELSQIIPGLGPVASLAGSGFRDMGEGAEEGAAGMEALITSLGPIAVVILSIQAAVEYWHIFTDASKEAARALGETYKQIQDDSQKALDDLQKLQDAVAGENKRPEKQFEEELRQKKTLLEGQQKVADEVAKAQEQADLEAAGKNEAAKAEIQQKYAREAQDRKLSFAQQEIDLQNEVLAKAQQNVNVSQVHIDTLKGVLAGIPASDTKLVDSYLKQIAQSSDSATKVQEFINNLKGDISTGTQALGFDRSGAAQVNQITDRANLETGVRAALGDFGPKLDGKQQAALQEVQAMFAAVHGNLDTFVNFLRGLKLTNDQKMRDIDNELSALSQRVSAIPTQTSR